MSQLPPTKVDGPIDYASCLDRDLKYPDAAPFPPPLPVRKKPSVLEGGTMGTMDVVGSYRRQLGLGCKLLDGAWPSTMIPLLDVGYLYGMDLPQGPFRVEPVDQAWINAWKFWTKLGWFGYGGVAVLWIMSGGNAVLEFIDWWLVIWPCIIFTVVALLARWRVGWPILLVNLWLLAFIVKTILKWVLLVCGAVLVWHRRMPLKSKPPDSPDMKMNAPEIPEPAYRVTYYDGGKYHVTYT